MCVFTKQGMNGTNVKKGRQGRRSKSAKGDGNGNMATIDGMFNKKRSSSSSVDALHPRRKKKTAESSDTEEDENDEGKVRSPPPPPTQQYRFLMNRCEVNLPVKPYPTQIAIMNAITKSVNKSENVLIESATGTGKSLALICASLAAARRLTLSKLETAQPHPPSMPVGPPSDAMRLEMAAQSQLRQVDNSQQQSKQDQHIRPTQLKPEPSLQSQPTQPIQLVQVKPEPSMQTQQTQQTQPVQLVQVKPEPSTQTQQTQQIQPIQVKQEPSTNSQQEQLTQITQPFQIKVGVGNKIELVFLPQPMEAKPDPSIQTQQTQIQVKSESEMQYTQPTQPVQIAPELSIYSQQTQQTQQTQPVQIKPEPSIYSQQTQFTQPTQPVQNEPEHSIYSQQTQALPNTTISSQQIKPKAESWHLHKSIAPQSTPQGTTESKGSCANKPAVIEGKAQQSDKHCDAGGFIVPGGNSLPAQSQSPAVTVSGGGKNLVRVFYGTRTHSQVKQIVKEVQRTMYKPLTVVLASRKHYCIFDKVRESPDRDDLCVKIMLKKVDLRCPFSNGEALKKFVRQPCGSTRVPGTEYEHKDYISYDVEDLVKEGRELGSCPYNAANELVAEAELIVSPYNYIISESIRSSRHINLENDIVVIDEAHNISNSLMDVASYDMPMNSLKSACMTLRKAAKNMSIEILSDEYRACLRFAARVLESYTKWMEYVEPSLIRQDFEHYYKCWRGPEILEIYKSFGLPSIEHIALFVYTIDCACGKNSFTPEAVDKFKPILKISGLFEENPIDMMLPLQDNPVMNPTNFGQAQKGGRGGREEEEEPKYYRKESKISKPSKKKKGADNGKKGISSLFSDDSDEKSPTIIEGPDMICATMASSSANFILNHPEYVNDYRLIVDKVAVTSKGIGPYRSTVKEWAMSLGLWCMSPAVAFKGINDPSQSVILASGTLAPFDPLVQELRTPFPTRVELSHVIDKCQVIACTAKKYELSYSNTDNLDVQDYVGNSILECCRVIPSGILCFFPSYALLSKLVKRWKETGIYDEISESKGCNVFSELEVSKGSTQKSENGDKKRADDAEFSAFIKEFHKCARTPEGAILFAVCRGKSSEGVDFADESARGVVVVGVPYSSIHNVRISLKREYEEASCSGAGTRWYLADGHRAVNQAIGRIIRNKWDYGAVVFLDSRYSRMNVRNELSKWIRNQICEVNTVHDFVPTLKNFFENVPSFVKRRKEEFMAAQSSQSSQASQASQQASQQGSQQSQTTK